MEKAFKYVLRVDSGTLVEVTRVVYLEWHRTRRRENYQMEKKRAHGEALKRWVKISFCYYQAGTEKHAGEKCVEIGVNVEIVRKHGPPTGTRHPAAPDAFFTDVELSCRYSRKSMRKRRDRILGLFCM